MIIKTLFYLMSKRPCKGWQLRDKRNRPNERMINLDKNTEG